MFVFVRFWPFLSVYFRLCLFLSVSVRLYLFLSVFFSFSPLVSISFHLCCIRPFPSVSVCFCLFLSVFLYFCLFMFVPVQVCVFLSVSVCFCLFLIVLVRFCLFMSVLFRLCPFLSTVIRFCPSCPFLSIFVRFSSFQSLPASCRNWLEMAGNNCKCLPNGSGTTKSPGLVCHKIISIFSNYPIFPICHLEQDLLLDHGSCSFLSQLLEVLLLVLFLNILPIFLFVNVQLRLFLITPFQKCLIDRIGPLHWSIESSWNRHLKIAWLLDLKKKWIALVWTRFIQFTMVNEFSLCW